MRDLELLEGSGVKTILYPANTQKNVQTLRFFKINHFFINHGESDKVVNQSKFLMAYDKLLVAGPLAERRMREAGLPLRENQVVHVGRPQVELLLQRTDAKTSAIRNVLYAPTWEGFVEEANYSSVNQFGLSMIKTLSKVKDLHVYFKPHPYTGHNKKGDTGRYLVEMTEFAKAHGMTVVDGRAPIFDYMNLSDLMITDISSVLNDYLYTLKPMILTNARGQSKEHIFAEYPSTPSTYILSDPSSVSTLLTRILQNDDLFDIRKQVCRDSLGDFPEGSMRRFNRVVSESARGATYSEHLDADAESEVMAVA
jgi:CDP-glycerol glycerophosphotransferase (TagB/SpsB family)